MIDGVRFRLDRIAPSAGLLDCRPALSSELPGLQEQLKQTAKEEEEEKKKKKKKKKNTHGSN